MTKKDAAAFRPKKTRLLSVPKKRGYLPSQKTPATFHSKGAVTFRPNVKSAALMGGRNLYFAAASKTTCMPATSCLGEKCA